MNYPEIFIVIVAILIAIMNYIVVRKAEVDKEELVEKIGQLQEEIEILRADIQGDDRK